MPFPVVTQGSNLLVSGTSHVPRGLESTPVTLSERSVCVTTDPQTQEPRTELTILWVGTFPWARLAGSSGLGWLLPIAGGIGGSCFCPWGPAGCWLGPHGD